MWIVGLGLVIGLIVGATIGHDLWVIGAAAGALVGWAISSKLSPDGGLTEKLAALSSEVKDLGRRLAVLETRLSASTPPSTEPSPPAPSELAWESEQATPTPVPARVPESVTSTPVPPRRETPISEPRRTALYSTRDRRWAQPRHEVAARPEYGRPRRYRDPVLRRRFPAQVRLRAHACARRAPLHGRRARRGRAARSGVAAPARPARLRLVASRRRNRPALSHDLCRFPAVFASAAASRIRAAARGGGFFRRACGAAGFSRARRGRRERRFPCAHPCLHRAREPRDAVLLLPGPESGNLRHRLLQVLATSQPSGLSLHLRDRDAVGRHVVSAGALRLH